MKLVTYLKGGHEQLAMIVNGKLYDTDWLHPDLPISMAMFLNYWDDVYPIALAAEQQLLAGVNISSIPLLLEEIGRAHV